MLLNVPHKPGMQALSPNEGNKQRNKCFSSPKLQLHCLLHLQAFQIRSACSSMSYGACACKYPCRMNCITMLSVLSKTNHNCYHALPSSATHDVCSHKIAAAGAPCKGHLDGHLGNPQQRMYISHGCHILDISHDNLH